MTVTVMVTTTMTMRRRRRRGTGGGGRGGRHSLLPLIIVAAARDGDGCLAQYVAWSEALGGEGMRNENMTDKERHATFFSDNATKAMFSDHMRAVIMRNNSVTGCAGGILPTLGFFSHCSEA